MSRVGRANPINVPKYEDPIPPSEAFAYERVCFMPSKDLRPLLYKIITIFNHLQSVRATAPDVALLSTQLCPTFSCSTNYFYAVAKKRTIRSTCTRFPGVSDFWACCLVVGLLAKPAGDQTEEKERKEEIGGGTKEEGSTTYTGLHISHQSS